MVVEQLIAVLNAIFAPLLVLKPHLSLFIISTFLTALVLFINRLTINKDVVRGIKQRMEETRENLTKAQKEGAQEEAKKFLAEMMKTNNEYMKHTFKALIVSIVVISLFLPWLRYTYDVTYKGVPVAKLPLSIPFLGADVNWLYWYIFVSVAIGWLIRKLMGVEYG